MFSSSGYQALRKGAALLDRTDRGWLLLTGQDRRSLLQGLLTNDVAALGPGTGCYAALLTANGRMVADMRVLELGEGLLLDLVRSLAPAMLKRLDESIFSEDVQIRDLSDERAMLGVYGPAAPETIGRAAGEASLADSLATLPEHGSRTIAVAGADVLAVRSTDVGVDGYDCLVSTTALTAVRQAFLAAGAVAIDAETAEVTRIEAGRPAFLVDMDEDTIPLEAGIESRAVSLTKGCYVGQEIIIRVLHRGGGRVARRLVGLVLQPGGEVPVAGDRVASGDRDVGVVTSAAQSPLLDRAIALAMVHRDFTEPGTPLSVGRTQTAAAVQPLPFVPTELSSGA